MNIWYWNKVEKGQPTLYGPWQLLPINRKGWYTKILEVILKNSLTRQIVMEVQGKGNYLSGKKSSINPNNAGFFQSRSISFSLHISGKNNLISV